jgi:hypothetical protein
MSAIPPGFFPSRSVHGGTVISPARGEPAKGTNYPVPTGWRSVLRATSAMVTKCNEILKGREPKGTWILITMNGKDYLFAVEWHKHRPTDNVPAGLKEWHRGITVYEQR